MPGVKHLSPPLSLPTLQRFFCRADLQEVPGSDLDSTLCSLFGIQRGEHGDFPIAALCRAKRDGRFWLRAEPVCLRPDQSRLLLFDSLDFDVSADELKALAALFSKHFEAEEWLLDFDDPFCWYLSPANSSAISSHSLGDVFGRNMDLFLPQGGDRLRWHRLLNEVQMLFFSAEINQLREAVGKMPIGGLWFSGFGYMPERIAPRYRHMFGADRLTAGLAGLTGTPFSKVEDWREELLPKSGASLFVYSSLQRPVWRADTLDWAEKVAELGVWLGQRLDELAQGRLDELMLYPCDGRVFRFTRRHRYSFWRGSKPLLFWLQGEH